MEEDFIYKGSGMKASTKFILFTICLLLIAGAIVIFFRMNKFNVKKIVTYEVGDVISFDVRDYITNKPFNDKEYKLNIDAVSYDNENRLTTVGEYTYRVTMRDTIKEGKIIVKDTKAPKVETIELTLGVDDEYVIDDFIASCDDYSLPCTYIMESNIDTKKIGTQDVKIKVRDTQNNETTVNTKLIVKEGFSLKEEKVKNIEPKYLEPSYDDWNKQYVVKYAGGLDPEDSENSRWRYYEEFINDKNNNNLSKYLDEKNKGKTIKSSEVIAVYNKYHYIIGFACRATLSDGTTTYLTNGE